MRLKLIELKIRECNHTISQFPILATGISRGDWGRGGRDTDRIRINQFLLQS